MRNSRWTEEELAAARAADAGKVWPDPPDDEGEPVIDLDAFYAGIQARAGPAGPAARVVAF